jgi:hypothetical protein
MTMVDGDRKRQILAAENTARLARALADRGVYVLGGLSAHGLEPTTPETVGVPLPKSLQPVNRPAVRAGGGNQMTTHTRRDADVDTPHAVHVAPGESKPDQLAPHAAEAEDRQEALIDEGVEETFPASDPVSAKRIT